MVELMPVGLMPYACGLESLLPHQAFGDYVCDV